MAHPMAISKTAAAAAALALAAAAQAGLWDDVKEGVKAAREIVDDVDETRGEAKGTVGDAKDMAEETSEEVGAVVPEREAGAEAPPPPSARSAPPPPSARQWQIDVGGGETRSVGQAELGGLIRAGEVDRDTFVWSEELGDWTPAGEVPALGGYFAR